MHRSIASYVLVGYTLRDKTLACTMMKTGKVTAYAVVSVYGEGEGFEVMQASGIELIRAGLVYWKKYGMPV